MVKIIIAGGRDFNDFNMLEKCVLEITEPLKDFEIVSGMAKGADSLGVKFAQKYNKKVHKFPAKWDDLDVPGAVIRRNKWGQEYNCIAGHQRNDEMRKISKILIAFWDGKSRGTLDMIKKAKKHGLITRVIAYEN